MRFWEHISGLFYFLSKKEQRAKQIEFKYRKVIYLSYQNISDDEFQLKISLKQTKPFPKCRNVENSLYVIYTLSLGIALVIGESDAAGLQ